MPDPVRIAVIDSGVQPVHPHIDAARLLPGIEIEGDKANSEWDSCDALGHGTAVTAAIQHLSPDCICLPVRVFHSSLRTTARALVRAIDAAIAAEVDLINLSLGTINPAHRQTFAESVDRARTAGVLIVAAREVDGTPCYPGSLDGVIGVSLDWDLPRDQWEARDGCFFASGHPRPIPGVPQRRNLHGVSFAVANMSGLIARGGRAEVARWRDQAAPRPINRSTIQKQPIAPVA